MSDVTKRLSALFDCIIDEMSHNADFADKIDKCLRGQHSRGAPAKSKRNPAKLNPVAVFTSSGKAQLTEQLKAFTADELKDIVAQYALDDSRRAMKWKNTERIIALIADVTEQRIKRGDAFRT